MFHIKATQALHFVIQNNTLTYHTLRVKQHHCTVPISFILTWGKWLLSVPMTLIMLANHPSQTSVKSTSKMFIWSTIWGRRKIDKDEYGSLSEGIIIYDYDLWWFCFSQRASERQKSTQIELKYSSSKHRIPLTIGIAICHLFSGSDDNLDSTTHLNMPCF